MLHFSNRSVSWNGAAISESETLEATEFSKMLGARIILKLKKLGAKLLKFRITSIRITPTLNLITPITITPTWITIIWFPPTFQTMISPTFRHYNKYFYEVQWMKNLGIFPQEHLWYILACHWYTQPLWYIHTIRYHRWDLTVPHYNIIRVNYPYPFLGKIVWQFCMIFLDKTTIKNSQIVTVFPHYGKIPYFF